MACKTSYIEIGGVRIQIKQFAAYDGFVFYAKIDKTLEPFIKELQKGRFLHAVSELLEGIESEEEIEDFSNTLLSCASIDGITLTADTDTFNSEELAILLGNIIVFNYAGMWKERFSPPNSESASASTYCPYTKRIDAATQKLSVPPIIYMIVMSESKLATLRELQETYSVDDALELFEMIQLQGYVSNQQFKKAEARQSK